MLNSTALHEPISPELEAIARQITDGAFKVHKALGPGLLESVYESCLLYELTKRGLKVERQVVLPIQYDELKLDSGLRIDMLIENAIVIELKAVENLLPIHEAQMLTYLKLSNCRLGFLINFNVAVIKSGIRRFVL